MIDTNPEDKHPELFRSVDRGVECGPGWHKIINECLKELKELFGKHHEEFMVPLIKEKFGVLNLFITYTAKNPT